MTSVSMARQVPSPSNSGSVAVTQSTILRSPVVVVCSAGWSRSTPESMTPMVTPRPSQVGLAALKSTDPVSLVGMYGFASGVDGPGASTDAVAPARPALSTVGSGSGIDSLRSTASTLASPATFSTAEVGTVARTYPMRSLVMPVKPPLALTDAATLLVAPFSVAMSSVTRFSPLVRAFSSRVRSC